MGYTVFKITSPIPPDALLSYIFKPYCFILAITATSATVLLIFLIHQAYLCSCTVAMEAEV